MAIIVHKHEIELIAIRYRSVSLVSLIH